MFTSEEQPTPAPAPSVSTASEPVLVPRKKRMTKGQPRIQTSIDVLAEVLAERCGDAYESDEYEPEDDGEEEDVGSDGNERAGNRDREEKDPEDSAKKRTAEPYKFTRCKLKNRHFLREGQGLAMIRALGLEQFLLHTEVPRFNRSHCTEFITTYNHHKGSGTVNGRVIRITPQAVRKVTGLPLGHRGERAVVHDVRAEDLPVMDRLIPGLKRTSYGYDLRFLRYKDQTETFVAVASALSEKLVCRTFKLTYIKGAIILAMETSLRLKILMQWADFMAETIKNALKLTQLRTRNVRFAFGEWLTGMIENALAEDVGAGENGQGGESERELKDEPVEGLVEASGTGEAQEPLPLVVQTVLHPQKFKKRARTVDMADEVQRLQLELAEAEKRERWFVAMNVGMSREIERLRKEVEGVKGSSSSGTLKHETETEREREREMEMQIVLKESPRQTKTSEQQLLDRLIEHLQSRSVRHEAEVLRLKHAVEEQSNYIELIKQGRATVGACGEEAFDEASLLKEQKRLRREWDKEKLKSAAT